MNKVILIGNIASDVEVKQTNGGVSVCSFRLAVQRKFANAQVAKEADFFSVVVWRQLAELCGKYCAKGKKVAVVGELQNRSYDAKDGSKRFLTEIIADEVEFLGGKDDRQGETPRGRQEMTPADNVDGLPF